MISLEVESEDALGRGRRFTAEETAAMAPLPATFTLVTRERISAETESGLRRLLTHPEGHAGLRVREDPKRKGFYDIQHEGRIYFVYVYPSRAKVLLLKAWPA